MFLSKVCIWKLCWLAVALSGLMLELEQKRVNFITPVYENLNLSEPTGHFQVEPRSLLICAATSNPNLTYGVFKDQDNLCSYTDTNGPSLWVRVWVTEVYHCRDSHSPAIVICMYGICFSFTHIAISNCSIHFLLVSSVLQKNWKPCFPCRWIR